jgi:hypothetical protein
MQDKNDKELLRSLETSKSLLSKMQKDGAKWGWPKDKLEHEKKIYKDKIAQLTKELDKRDLK